MKKYIKKIQRNNLRQMMRGYRNLKKIDRLNCISNIKRDLTNQELIIPKNYFSHQLFGAGIKSAELILRQYLLMKVGGNNLNKAILKAAGNDDSGIAFWIPLEWVKVIEKYGFRVDRFKSGLMWRLYVFMMLLKGVLKTIEIVISSLVILKKQQNRIEHYVYFSDLNENNFPKTANWQNEHNIISWYMQWVGRKANIKTICHSAPKTNNKNFRDIEIITQPSPIPGLINLNELIKYIGWALVSTFLALIDFFRWRWWHALLLSQSALSAQVRFSRHNFLARDYLFHNSSWIYRPLWTYDAEKFGATITLYFYSTNCEPFKKESGYPEMSYGWRAMSWSRYLVWNEYQANFVRRCVGDDARINVVGPIWFSSNLTQLNNIASKTVAVFDVQPVRNSYYNSLALDFDYYTPQVTIQFLADIHDIISGSTYAMALKRKRDVGTLTHPKYRFFIKALDKAENFIKIDSELSATRLIENCDFVISMPFTSTALLGRYAGKPSIYYDPLSLLQSDDRAAHGIPIVQGKEMLRTWFLSTVEKNFVNH